MIFKENAEKYWAAGLPVMPLRPSTKIPALNAWQSYCAVQPTAAEKEAWLAGYPDGNIGLPLGPASGVIALDLDSIDPRVEAILDAIMPPSPWKRIGKKGAVYAFKYNGERTYRIKGADGGTILEILSRGAQVVLPPSIHPDTQRPYEANANLADVLGSLVALPAQFETMVRQALIDTGIELSSRGTTKVAEWVPSGGRDSALTAMAGILARSVGRKERTLLEALNEIETWVASFTEKVVGDAMDPDKGRKKVLEFIRRDIVDNRRQLPVGWDAGMTPDEIREMRTYFGDEAEEWPLQQLLDYLSEQFTTIPKDNIPARQTMIEDVVFRLSQAQHLTTIEKDAVVNFIVSGSGRSVTSVSIRKRLVELQARDIKGTDHVEIAQALLVDLSREGEVRFHVGNFYQWYGAYWRRLDETTILKRLMEEFGDLPACRKYSDHKGILQVAQKLSAAELRTMDVPGVNFANGYLTDDMQMLEHDSRYGATYVMPYRFLPDERAPAMFMSFLDACWGQDDDYMDKVQALRESIASTLFLRAPRYQRAFCLFGVAGSGKTTLMDIVLGLVPSTSVSHVPPQDWSDKFLPTMMADMLINACGELSESVMIPGNQFKMVVEGTEMNGQYKSGQIFGFKPECSQWFASNHLPRSRDSSAGFNRRWLIFHFTQPVARDQKRIGLADEILAEEREAIVAWAMPAIRDLIRNADYTLPRSHLDQISEVAAQNNSVRFFLTADAGVRIAQPSASSESEKAEPKSMQEKVLFGLYFAFCKLRAGVPPVSMKRFRMMMQDLQSDLDFRLLIDRSLGYEEVSYTNIIVVPNVTARSSK